MQTLIQKIHTESYHSFACREYRTPKFETNWHRHTEYELIVITQGHGTLMAGDYIGSYKTGDVFFLAANLPHWFRKQHPKMVGAVVVVHFKKEIFGKAFLAQPEMKTINKLLGRNDGLQLRQKLKAATATIIKEIEHTQGLKRIHLLLDALEQIGRSSAIEVLTKDFTAVEEQVNPVIEKIINHSFKNYLLPVKLAEVATIANMTIPTFCRFFKKNIKKTYFEFLQELRISHACKLLSDTNKAVLEICYESGFNSWAHFSKKFKALKQITPLQYRKQFN
jgi:AraC-like DNA-binding protein